MTLQYDDQNIFARILRGEIPNDTVAENEHALAFRDISPKTPTHVLVIPKGRYVSFEDFSANATSAEITGFMRLCAEVLSLEDVGQDKGGRGFRAITNAGPDGVQEVPHFHLHIMGGRMMGPMVNLHD